MDTTYMLAIQMVMFIMLMIIFLFQWSYGVTCWEVFTLGKTPYPALDPPTLLRMVKEGYRLETPDNMACSPEMYVGDL